MTNKNNKRQNVKNEHARIMKHRFRTMSRYFIFNVPSLEQYVSC